MEINIEKVPEIKSMLSLLGDIEILSEELKDTLANIYCKVFRGFIYNDMVEGIREESKAVINFQKSSMLISVLIDIKHKSKGSNEASTYAKYMEVLVLDVLKYNIPKAQNKSPIRRAIERKFHQPNEMAGLYKTIMSL